MFSSCVGVCNDRDALQHCVDGRHYNVGQVSTLLFLCCGGNKSKSDTMSDYDNLMKGLKGEDFIKRRRRRKSLQGLNS